MRTRIAATVALAGLALAAAGCVSLKRTPDARFFVLQSDIATGAAGSSDVTPEAVIGLEKVLLPGHLMRPQLVTWKAPNEVSVDEFLRWAEPLDDGVARVLAEDLAALLPDDQVIRRPWRADTRTRCRVEVVLEVFGLQPDGRVLLEGRWRLLPDQGELALVQRPVKLEQGPLSGGAQGEAVTGVDEMSQLIADLSRQIAAAIRTLPPPEEAAEVEDEAVRVEDLEER
jgi:uncharacterized lipoprotein YmbA